MCGEVQVPDQHLDVHLIQLLTINKRNTTKFKKNEMNLILGLSSMRSVWA